MIVCSFISCLCREWTVCCFIFFFKQKTAYEMRISDWSSDVCSSDLHRLAHSRGDALLGSELGDNHPLAAEQLRLRRQHFRGRRGSGLYRRLSRRHLRDEHRRLQRLTPPARHSEGEHPVQWRKARVKERASA